MNIKEVVIFKKEIEIALGDKFKAEIQEIYESKGDFQIVLTDRKTTSFCKGNLIELFGIITYKNFFISYNSISKRMEGIICQNIHFTH